MSAPTNLHADPPAARRRLLPSRTAVGRIGSFALSTVLGSAVSIVAIPVLIERSGAAAWADLAVGQAVGTVLAVFVAFGWGVTGPYAVAVRSPAEARGYYLQSARIRTVLFLITAGPAVVAVLLFARGQVLAASLAALGVMSGNLGGGWLYIGRSRPNALLLLDTLPKAAAVLVGVLLVLAGAPLWTYALVLLVVSLLTAVVAVGSALRLAPASADPPRGPRAALRVLREQIGAVVVAATAALYVSAPLLAVSALTPAGAPVYAVADRVTKFSLNGVNPIAQVLQGWVPSRDRQRLVDRCRTATLVSVLLGLLGGVVLAPVLLLGAPLLTGGRVELPLLLVLLFAAAFASITVSRTVGLVCLVALGRVRSLAISTVSGAVIGVAGLVALTPAAGVVGAATAFLLSEVAVTVVQLLSMRRAMRGTGGVTA